jgi:nitrite reductase/ring-hydroxylating ferredoxin subunit
MSKAAIARWDELADRVPAHALVGNVDLVIIRYDDQVSVLYGRCLHRGALLADGHTDGSNLICGVHEWDYRFDTGISEYNSDERLAKFTAWVEDGQVRVDAEEIAEWERDKPQPYHRDTYQGAYADVRGTIDEPHVKLIHEFAEHGLEKMVHHGPVAAKGVPRYELPGWDSIQIVTAQLANAAIQAIGCLGMRACHTNNCPVGMATQKPQLRERLVVEPAAQRLARFFEASVELMKVLARACGHNHLNRFCLDDLTTFDRDMASLSGVAYCGVTPS